MSISILSQHYFYVCRVLHYVAIVSHNLGTQYFCQVFLLFLAYLRRKDTDTDSCMYLFTYEWVFSWDPHMYKGDLLDKANALFKAFDSESWIADQNCMVPFKKP